MAERHLKLAFTLGFLALAGPFAIDMYLPALPAIARDLGVSVAAVQGSISGYFSTFGVAQLVYGPLADQLGRKRPIYFGMALFILGSLGAATSQSIEALIAWRAVQGAGAAVGMVIPRAVVRDTGTGPAATRMMAGIMLVISISPMVAPLTGSAVIALFGWRGVFFAMATMAVFSAVLTATVLPETLAPEDRVPVNLATMRRGMTRLIRDPKFMGLSLTAGLGFSSFMVFIASAPFVYTGQYGLSPTGFSLAFACNAIGFFSASQMAGPLGERFGGETVVRGGAGLFVAATLTLTLSVTAGFAPFWLIVGALFVGNAGLGVVLPNVMVMALDDHGPIAGLASSFSGTLQMVTGGISVIVAGQFFDGSALPMVASIAFCGLAVLVVSTLTLRRRTI